MIECQPDLHRFTTALPSRLCQWWSPLQRVKGCNVLQHSAFCTLQPSLSRAEHWSCLKPVSPEAGFAWRGWCVCLSGCCSCSCSCSCPSNAAKPSVCALCATSLNLLAAPPCRCAPFDQPLEGISDALAGSPSRRKCAQVDQWLSALPLV
jgi:hypothetical protein